MERRTQQAIEAALGASIERARTCAGGDINDAVAAELADGRTVFVKTNAGAEAAMFPAEARGLQFLREANALPIPKVLAVSSGAAGEPSFLVLEYLPPSPAGHGHDERVGRGLAALHRFGAPSFGLDHDNFIGRLPQANAACERWVEFYGERRILREVRRARDAGHFDEGARRAFEGLCVRLDDLLGPEEPPARLHGDLWGGNLHTSGGQPYLIDPAVYGGHREVDLAMMRLFGGFSSTVFSAYEAAFPLAPGAAERVELYQLYPVLVHVNLFGGGYVGSALRIAKRYGR
ncbi:MAG TPA: fructosamine kinase family protein [Polyangiaceae bacterium]|nr:fructosamine kinase family protein [Polyangiaceae bacterium]